MNFKLVLTPSSPQADDSASTYLLWFALAACYPSPECLEFLRSAAVDDDRGSSALEQH